MSPFSIKTYHFFKIGFAFSILAILFSCNQKSKVANTFVPLEISIALQKTMCYGTCPSYNFEVLNNGKATLRVGRFAEEVLGRTLDNGNYEGTAPLDEVSDIIQYAQGSGYFLLEDRYDNPMIMDIPATISTINGKTVFNRYDGPNLTELYKKIENLMSKIDWTAKPETEK
ncbi:MAG: hypothetical protein COA49_08485 [Bacteroidetes bacterium]|nr:MAG: hypothetical protein COA49_08485 [Bacteroidota bacterium]